MRCTEGFFSKLGCAFFALPLGNTSSGARVVRGHNLISCCPARDHRTRAPSYPPEAITLLGSMLIQRMSSWWPITLAGSLLMLNCISSSEGNLRWMAARAKEGKKERAERTQVAGQQNSCRKAIRETLQRRRSVFPYGHTSVPTNGDDYVTASFLL